MLPRPLRLPVLTALASLLGACSTIGEPPHDWLLLPTAAVVALDNGYLKVPAVAAAVAVYALVNPWHPTGPSRKPGWARSVTASSCA